MREHRKPRFVSSYLDELGRLLRIVSTLAFIQKDKPPPNNEWLLGVADVVDGFKPETPGKTHVYLACLWNCNNNGLHGIYVGQTGLSVQERYKQHKDGIKAGRKWVYRFGIGLMEPLFLHLLNMGQDDAIDIEHEVAIALSEEGFVVKGGH